MLFCSVGRNGFSFLQQYICDSYGITYGDLPHY